MGTLNIRLLLASIRPMHVRLVIALNIRNIFRREHIQRRLKFYEFDKICSLNTMPFYCIHLERLFNRRCSVSSSFIASLADWKIYYIFRFQLRNIPVIRWHFIGLFRFSPLLSSWSPRLTHTSAVNAVDIVTFEISARLLALMALFVMSILKTKQSSRKKRQKNAVLADKVHLYLWMHCFLASWCISWHVFVPLSLIFWISTEFLRASVDSNCLHSPK